MAHDLTTTVAGLSLRSPLIAASGTVGSVAEWATVADVAQYGAAVAKSVAPIPWAGRAAPRVAPTEAGMLNGIGIQNPGIDSWLDEMIDLVPTVDVPMWGSAVGGDPEGFALVAKGLEKAGVAAVEVNLSCPNLDDGEMFSFDPRHSAEVVEAVAASVSIPIGAKLSPNTPDLVGVASACAEAGADFGVVTNTALGFGVSLTDRLPLLSGGVGGYSGPGLKPIALRCVYDVTRALPGWPVVGCGGVSKGQDVLEYLIVGAVAVEAGTVHFAEPNAGRRIVRELVREMRRVDVVRIREVIGTLGEW